MNKLVFGKATTQAQKADMVAKRYGADTGAGNGSKPAPKSTVSLKGSNPAKGKLAVTLKKKV